LEAQLGAARETLAQLWHDYDALRHVQAQFQEEVQRRAELEQQHQALLNGYSQLLEEHKVLRQQVAMASRSRWCALGRVFGVGPRFD
jgi:beta-phosphoglucomutase-like phosphatase (HAD superfamily)